MKRNLVMGTATGYSAEQLRPFVASLRATGYEGELALVVLPEQQETLAALAREYAITLAPVVRRDRLQNRGRMRLVQKAVGHLFKNGPVWNQLHHFFHIGSARYFIYHGYLARGTYSTYSNVLLTDVRDVAFQDDPFRYSEGRGLCCYMDAGLRLGDEPINTEWVTVALGEGYFQRQKGSRISCAGTTLGDAQSIMTYLRLMCVEHLRVLARVPNVFGLDQAIHNYLLWEKKIPEVLYCENGRHAVMTLKNARIEDFQIDAEGRLLNFDGTPAPVLHQFEFHPVLHARN